MEQTARPLPPSEEPLDQPLVQVSVATLLFALILFLAALLRLADLGELPLSQQEAEAALTTWSFWHDLDPTGGAQGLISPAYFTASALFAAIFRSTDGAVLGDALARLAPALSGVLAVALFWLARSRLGLGASLTTALLLAISPMAALISRQAGGDALALLALVTLLVAAWRAGAEGGSFWPSIAAGALGSGLASSPLFYSGLLALVVAWLAYRRANPAASSRDGEVVEGKRLLLVATATFLAVATCFLLRPAGMGGAAAQLSGWLGAFALPASFAAFLAPLGLLARYELAAIALGAGALIWAVWRAYPLPRFLAFWLVAALVLLLAQPGQTGNVLLAALPAYLLAGQWLQHAFRQAPGEATWGLFVFLLGTGVVVFFNGIRFLRLTAGQQDGLGFALLVALVLALAIVTVNLVRGWDSRGAFQGTLLALLVLLGAFSWATAWWLAHHAANDPRTGLGGVATNDDVRLLVETLREISYQTRFERYDVPLLVAVDSPALRWYLRPFNAVQYGETVPPGTATTALITRAGAPPPPVEEYASIDLALSNTGVERNDGARVAQAGETLRWWFFRESPTSVVHEQITLWVRQDALPWSR